MFGFMPGCKKRGERDGLSRLSGAQAVAFN
jgi:hypothetical protein